jgi:hypothetical protein
MKKSISAPMNAGRGVGMDDYQAQDDARTLGDAHQMRSGTHPTFNREKEIKGDKKRHAAAKEYAKKEHSKRMAEAASMAAVAGGGKANVGAGGGASDKVKGAPVKD